MTVSRQERARAEAAAGPSSGRRGASLVIGIAALCLALLTGIGLARGHHSTTLAKPKHYPVDGPDQLRQVAVGDVNGDGRSDIVVTDNFNPNAWVLRGARHGFKAATPLAIGNVSHALALGDIDHDRKADIASGSVNLAVTQSHNGYLTFTYYFPTSGVAIADVNHDGNRDVLASGESDGGNDNIGVLLATHTGLPIGGIQSFPTSADPVGLAVGKLNADNDPDIGVVGTVEGLGTTLQLFRGHGDGTFTPANKSLILSNGQADGMVGGNFNGDRYLDIAVTQGCQIPSAPKVLVALGKDGGFKAPSATNAPKGICGAEPAAADVNGDHHLDVLAAENDGTHEGDLAIFFGNGKGRVAKAKEFPAVSSAQSVAVGKLNGDKRPDAVVPDTGPTKVAVLYGKKR